MRKTKQTFNEIMNDGIDAGRFYKLSNHQMEKELRHHVIEAPVDERRKIYENYFKEKK